MRLGRLRVPPPEEYPAPAPLVLVILSLLLLPPAALFFRAAVAGFVGGRRDGATGAAGRGMGFSKPSRPRVGGADSARTMGAGLTLGLLLLLLLLAGGAGGGGGGGAMVVMIYWYSTFSLPIDPRISWYYIVVLLLFINTKRKEGPRRTFESPMVHVS